MSELKEHMFCECDELVREYRGTLSNEMRPYYLKSEADKVIAHQKYKRCLAKADKCAETAKRYYYLICLDGSNNPKYDRFPNKMDFWGRWHKRWLELAEKFKEAK